MYTARTHSLLRPVSALALATIALAAVVAIALMAGARDGSPGLTRTADDLTPVIVRASGSTDAAASAVLDVGGVVQRQFGIIPAVEALVPAAALDELARHSSVAAVTPNASVITTGGGSGSSGNGPGDGSYKYAEAIGAEAVWAAGYKGRNVTIAIVDTGLNLDDADFEGRVLARWAASGSQSDTYGHGTHVAGIAAGNGNDSDGKYVGVAPKANLVGVKVTGGTAGTIGDVVAGLDWVNANRQQHNIRVVNLSLTQDAPQSYLTSPVSAAVEQLWFNGVTVVVAAGNRGSSLNSVDHPPANDPFVITVGAYGDNATVTSADDTLKSWSSRGVTAEGYAKPDLIAPGSKIIASVGKDSATLYSQNPGNRVDRTYFRMGGTSAAAPVVSGVIALMLEANPTLTPDQIKARLRAAADPFAGSGAPAIDAWEAVFGGDAGVANQGQLPSLWIDRNSGNIQNTPTTWAGITWDGITWDGITWDGITWDGITWDGITWDGITWDGITWDGITWAGITWDGVTWDGVTWDGLVNE